MKRFSEASEAFLRKFMKKKDKYYICHRKYPYRVFRYNKPISRHPYSVNPRPYCIYASTNRAEHYTPLPLSCFSFFRCHIVTLSRFEYNSPKTYLLCA